MGELSIVAYYNDELGLSSGHAFLMYKSNVNDSLDFSKYYGVYKLNRFYEYNPNWNSTFELADETEQRNFIINRNEYISFDAAADSVGNSSGSSGSSSTGDSFFNINAIINNLEGGTWINWEFRNVACASGLYKPNLALTCSINSKQLNSVIECYRTARSYSIYSSNCAKVASEAWNEAFNDNLEAQEFGFYTPHKLSESIANRGGEELDLSEIIEGMGFRNE